ncbi:hypothetical protein SAMN02910262_02480 [[Clostridium] aminophilum]|uniref:Uncharacterized protein n=1 Tax=[Clostridium] aminophilum TaxID=1526 RepID=A0A1I6KEW4_9FIRM|nr:hypothetical protein SAMN02910262_02480 [[Clostridium] aminophilum]
MTDVWVTSGT